MTATMPSHIRLSFAPLFFARETDLDFEFDDEFEDFDDPRHQPPRRRWIPILLLILLAIGVWYIVTDPERRSSVVRMMPDTIRAVFDVRTEAPAPERERIVPPPSNDPPLPAFYEGQRVAVGLKEGRSARFRLRNEAHSEPLGPVVQTGDVLTVIDGTLREKAWLYFVETEAGKSGWIQESDLQPTDSQPTDSQRTDLQQTDRQPQS